MKFRCYDCCCGLCVGYLSSTPSSKRITSREREREGEKGTHQGPNENDEQSLDPPSCPQRGARWDDETSGDATSTAVVMMMGCGGEVE